MIIENMINDTLKKAWNNFKNQYVVLVIGTILALLCMVFIITIPPMIFGIFYICVQIVQGKTVKVSDIFKGFNYFFTSWGLVILGLIGIAIGLALLVIPGIILLILLQYAIAVSIMEKRGPLDSLKRSYAIGKENFLFSIMLFLILLVIMSLGAITTVGALITMPFNTLATVVATQKIAGKRK